MAKIIFMGTPDFSVLALQNIAQHHDIVAVYTQPPRPAGRGQKLQKSPVHLKAELLGLPVFTPNNFKNSEDVEKFQSHDADFAVVVAYGLILPPAIFEAPKINTVNIHASLLPRWRGADPIRHAILAGDEITGVCIMKVEKGLDTGDVYLTEETPILSDDTGQSLHDILSVLGGNLILDYLKDYKMLTGVSQKEDGMTYASKFSKKDMEIDWMKTAKEIDQHVRAFFPSGAIYIVNDLPIKVKKAKIIEEQTTQKPGTILSKEDLKIACGNGTVIQLEILQRPGKTALPREEFLKGAKDVF
ncbi:MAG: methionyl-tRNA formyltransferase [Alphaproteobacteria bacterium]|nr:methionyl-tRNA formyltransferase [Alphaproteobacteria bacterium]